MTAMTAIAIDASTWSVGPASNGRIAGMTMYALRDGGGVPSFQPVKSEALGTMRVLFEPSVFNGTGEEERVNISLSVDDELEAALRAMEAQVRDKIRPSVPNIDALWFSCVKENHTLKAKIRLRGEHAVRCYGPTREPIHPPTHWRGLPVVPIVQVRGVFVQRSCAGLVLEVVATIIGEAEAISGDSFA